MKNKLFKLLEVGSRNVDFFCESDELEKFITDWLAVKNWNYSDFSRILKILKVEKPVKLRQFSDRSFEIYSIRSQSSIYATLFSSYRDPKEHSIMVSDKEGMQRVYTINYQYNGGIPLKLKILKEATANTESIYLNTFQITTQVDDYILKISSGLTTEFEGGVLQQYISNLKSDDFCCNVALIYQRIRSILNIHEKNNKSLYILSLKMLPNNKTKLQSSMRFDSKGDLTEFAKTNSVGETFHVFENGNWHYSNGNIIISYNSVRNHYNYNIVGGYHAIELVGNPIDLLNAILPEVLDLKNCLGNQVL